MTSNLNFVNTFFDKKPQNISNLENRETLESLSELPSLEIPDLKFPVDTVEQIIDESFKNEPEKYFLKDLFSRYPEVIAQHSLDCGTLKDHTGAVIEMTVPLKSKLPNMTKVYKLKHGEEEELESIFDFLIFNNLAEEINDANGSPCFLVTRSHTDQRASRLLLDLREVNRHLEGNVSTISDDIFTILDDVAKSSFCSQFDCVNAYFSYRLSKEALDSGIANIKLRTRTIRLRCLPQGLASAPKAFNDVIMVQMNTDDNGRFDPLNKFRSFYDDLFLFTTGSLEDHKIALVKFISRLARLGAKISLSKSVLLKNVKKDTLQILGYTISQGKLKPQDSKIKTIVNFPIPKTKQELQKFLGHLNFLRNVTPLTVAHWASFLYPLTGSKLPFRLEGEHLRAISEIKAIMETDLSYIEPFSNGVMVIYCDSSEKIFGSLAFSIDVQGQEGILNKDIMTSHLLNLKGLSPFSAHLEKYDLELSYFNDNLADTPLSDKFLFLIYAFSKDFQENIVYPDLQVIKNNLFNGVYRNIKKLESCFNDSSIDEFIQTLLHSHITDDVFEKYFAQLCKLISILLMVNVKIIFGHNRPCSTAYCEIALGYRSDLVLAWDCVHKKIYLVFVNNKYDDEIRTLNPSNIVDLNKASPDLILKQFLKTMDTENANKSIRLVGQFSKTVPLSEMNNPIYLKESLCVLYSLDYFKHHIYSSQLTVLLTDSEVSVYLFNQKVAMSKKRLYNFGIKILFSYPSVKVIHVKGKNNLSDFLSRLGIPKKVFWERGLTPLGVDKTIMAEIYNKPLTFKEVYKWVNDNPDLLKFSEDKMSGTADSDMYLSKDKPVLVSRLNSLFNNKKLQVFERLMDRGNLIKLQQEEFGGATFELYGDLMVFKNKVVLPKKLYSVKIMQEHFITGHARSDKIWDIITQKYHIVWHTDFRDLLKKLLNACIACVIHVAKPNYFKSGMFNPTSKGELVSLDFIEQMPGQNKYLLVFIDCYTKFLTVYPLPNKSGPGIVRCLINYLAVHGPIKFLLGDAAFRFEAIKNLAKNNGIHLSNSAAYNSTSRAHVESANKRIQLVLKTQLLKNNAHWDHALPLAVYILNNKTFLNTKVSPHVMQQGLQLTSFMSECGVLPDITGKYMDSDDVKQLLTDIEQNILEFQIGRQTLLKNKQTNKNERKRVHDFKSGEVVLVLREFSAPGTVNKLRYKYLGPYIIQKTRPHMLFLQSFITGIIICRTPGACKRVEGVVFSDVANFFEGDVGKIHDILGVFTHDEWELQVRQILEPPIVPTGAPQGARTRSRTAEKDNFDMSEIIDFYLNDDDDDQRQVSFQ